MVIDKLILYGKLCAMLILFQAIYGFLLELDNHVQLQHTSKNLMSQMLSAQRVHRSLRLK